MIKTLTNNNDKTQIKQLCGEFQRNFEADDRKFIKNRTVGFLDKRVLENAFLGGDAIDYLRVLFKVSQEGAIELANKFLDLGLIVGFQKGFFAENKPNNKYAFKQSLIGPIEYFYKNKMQNSMFGTDVGILCMDVLETKECDFVMVGTVDARLILCEITLEHNKVKNEYVLEICEDIEPISYSFADSKSKWLKIDERHIQSIKFISTDHFLVLYGETVFHFTIKKNPGAKELVLMNNIVDSTKIFALNQKTPFTFIAWKGKSKFFVYMSKTNQSKWECLKKLNLNITDSVQNLEYSHQYLLVRFKKKSLLIYNIVTETIVYSPDYTIKSIPDDLKPLLVSWIGLDRDNKAIPFHSTSLRLFEFYPWIISCQTDRIQLYHVEKGCLMDGEMKIQGSHVHSTEGKLYLQSRDCITVLTPIFLFDQQLGLLWHELDWESAYAMFQMEFKHKTAEEAINRLYDLHRHAGYSYLHLAKWTMAFEHFSKCRIEKLNVLEIIALYNNARDPQIDQITIDTQYLLKYPKKFDNFVYSSKYLRSPNLSTIRYLDNETYPKAQFELYQFLIRRRAILLGLILNSSKKMNEWDIDKSETVFSDCAGEVLSETDRICEIENTENQTVISTLELFQEQLEYIDTYSVVLLVDLYKNGVIDHLMDLKTLLMGKNFIKAKQIPFLETFILNSMENYEFVAYLKWNHGDQGDIMHKLAQGEEFTAMIHLMQSIAFIDHSTLKILPDKLDLILVYAMLVLNQENGFEIFLGEDIFPPEQAMDLIRRESTPLVLVRYLYHVIKHPHFANLPDKFEFIKTFIEESVLVCKETSREMLESTRRELVEPHVLEILSSPLPESLLLEILKIFEGSNLIQAQRMVLEIAIKNHKWDDAEKYALETGSMANLLVLLLSDRQLRDRAFDLFEKHSKTCEPGLLAEWIHVFPDDCRLDITQNQKEVMHRLSTMHHQKQILREVLYDLTLEKKILSSKCVRIDVDSRCRMCDKPITRGFQVYPNMDIFHVACVKNIDMTIHPLTGIDYKYYYAQITEDEKRDFRNIVMKRYSK